MSEQDQSDWLSFCQGNRLAFDRIYLRHRDAIFTFCLYLIGDSTAAEDIMQDTFVAMIDRSSTADEVKSLKGYLFVSARNRCNDRLRRLARVNSAQIESSNLAGVTPDQRLFIRQILGRLTPEESELILWREYFRFSIPEIAEMAHLAEEAVRSRLFRVRNKMQRLGKE